MEDAELWVLVIWEKGGEHDVPQVFVSEDALEMQLRAIIKRSEKDVRRILKENGEWATRDGQKMRCFRWYKVPVMGLTIGNLH